MKLCLRVLAALGLFLVMVLPASAQQSINYPNFCTTTGLTINGAAAGLNPNSACVLRLTNALSQGGSAFLTNTFSLAGDASFSTFFRFQMTNPQGIGDADGQGADGIVFAVQTVGNNVGGGGVGIGYQGISPSVGIEFDTFNNGSIDQNDGNHLGIDINGNVASAVLVPVAGRFNDGNIWFGWVDYNGVTDLLEARVSLTGSRPATPTASFTVDLPAVLGTTNAFVGFTSGTGSGANTHDILSWQLIGAFAPFPGGPAANVPTLSPVMLGLLAAGLAIAAVLLLKRL